MRTSPIPAGAGNAMHVKMCYLYSAGYSTQQHARVQAMLCGATSSNMHLTGIWMVFSACQPCYAFMHLSRCPVLYKHQEATLSCPAMPCPVLFCSLELPSSTVWCSRTKTCGSSSAPLKSSYESLRKCSRPPSRQVVLLVLGTAVFFVDTLSNHSHSIFTTLAPSLNLPAA